MPGALLQTLFTKLCVQLSIWGMLRYETVCTASRDHGACLGDLCSTLQQVCRSIMSADARSVSLQLLAHKGIQSTLRCCPWQAQEARFHCLFCCNAHR